MIESWSRARGRGSSALLGLLILAPLCLAVLLACGEDGEDDQGQVEASAVPADFEVDLPAGWHELSESEVEDVAPVGERGAEEGLDLEGGEELEVEILAIWRRRDAANVVVVKEPGSPGPRLLEAVVGPLRGAGWRVLTSGEGPDVGGAPSVLVDYEMPGARDLAYRLVTAAREDHIYSLTLTAPSDGFDTASADFSAILESWRWTE